MSKRSRHIAWMKAQGRYRFDDAINNAVTAYGLDWFTDKQIADIVALEVKRQRESLHITLSNRRYLRFVEERSVL